MSLRLGIRGKIALLVVVAAAISAYLVSRLLSRSAEELVRSHELVDLGDEAQLRGWELVDRVDGLREDCFALGFSPSLQSAAATGASEAELLEIARETCHRYWARYLRVDLIDGNPAEPGASRTRVIEEKATLVDPEAAWLPDPETFSSDGPQRVIELSEIQRLKVRRSHPVTGEDIEQWEPVIWASAALARPDQGSTGPQSVVRILMSLGDAESPRHLGMLLSPEGDILLRPDESGHADAAANESVFLEIARDEEVQAGLAGLVRGAPVEAASQQEEDDPQVQRLKLFEYRLLESHYWFQAGVPSAGLSRALEEEDESLQDDFLEQLRLSCRHDGRIGGLRGGVREMRLMSPSEEHLDSLRAKIEQALQERYGISSIQWRQPVLCDEIHAWAVRLGMGTMDQQSGYLLIYAVLDDELASSIHQELATLRLFALVIAGAAGVVAFMVSLFFVRPLQRMTQTAQRVAEVEPERLPTQLKRLVDHLPVERADEVGDIARASKRLFEEVLESQEMLENRVAERTAKLAQANLDLEEANDQLTSLSREKDAFVAKVSHDLRQPLNAIFLQVEALKLSNLDDQQSDDVARIHDHAARELNLVNDILEYQKIIMGAETLKLDEIDIARLVSDLESAHSPIAKSKGLDFIVDCGEGVGELQADRHRLQQVLDNLTTNAVKFTTEGSVKVSARARTVGQEEWIEISVADTGRGMEEEEQAKAFVPFVSNKKGNEGGTGLGLSICRELCQQMGGRIGFVSDFGKGTTFTVLLPRQADPDRYQPPASDDSLEAPAAERSEVTLKNEEVAGMEEAVEIVSRSEPPDAEVLVIDDDETVRALMKRTIEAEGYRVRTASGGEEGLREARKNPPQAITLDIVMPELDGWEVLSKLKSDPETEAIPVIMVSVMADRSESVALGVEDCLVKPIDLRRLSRVIRRVTGDTEARSLLLVDDDRDSREGLARLLEEEGWDPVEASNGQEAIRRLKNLEPVAIILDLVMPGMDGFGFLLELARHPKWCEIPVLVLTGSSPTGAEAEFLNRRVDQVITKGESSARQVIDRLQSRLGR